MPFILSKFLQDLTKKQKARLHDIQIELFDSGFGKNEDFVQKACREEAIRILRKELKDDPVETETPSAAEPIGNFTGRNSRR